MYFNRIEAKMAAKSSIRNTTPSPLLVSLVFFVLTGVLGSVLQGLVGDPRGDIMIYLQEGYSYDKVIEYVMGQAPGHFAAFGVLSLLLTLYNTVMDFGYTAYTLQAARNRQPGFVALFEGFSRLGRVLWAAILEYVFVTLWSLLVIVPLMVLMVVVILISPEYSLMPVVVTMATVCGCAVALVAISYRYRLTSFFLLDDPGCTARQAIRRSKETMRGWKMTLFMVDLSFFGWALLSSALGYLIAWILPINTVWNVLAFWILPYSRITVANFYDFVVTQTPIQSPGGYAGPHYDYHANDGPSPF